MPTFHVIHPDGKRTTHSAGNGKSLMRVATDDGVTGIAADCGGCMTCSTCHVFVDEAWAAKLPPRSADEDAMLDLTATERRPTSRLSCQIKLDDGLDGLVVTLPASQH
jgi:ferredoxin, 2Fe-2S